AGRRACDGGLRDAARLVVADRDTDGLRAGGRGGRRRRGLGRGGVRRLFVGLQGVLLALTSLAFARLALSARGVGRGARVGASGEPACGESSRDESSPAAFFSSAAFGGAALRALTASRCSTWSSMTARSDSDGDQEPKASASVGENPSSRRRKPSSTTCVQR